MNQSNANNTLRSLRNVFNRKKDSPFSLPNSSSSSSQQFPSYPPPPYHLHHNPAATAPQHSNAKMGRKEFLKDVDALQTYFASLKPNDAKLVSDFKFHDPELTFTFTYGLRKTFNIVLYINSVNNYPTKFSGFLCVNDDSGDRAVTNVASLLTSISLVDLPLSAILSSILNKCCTHFKIKSSRAFSREVLQAYSPSFATPSPSPRSFSSSSASGPLSSRQLLQRHLAECEHYLYKTHVFSADRFGFEVAIAFPAKRLGLSEDAATAWNLDVDRYIVCIMQFGTKYVDLQEIAKQVPNERYKSDYGQLKEACKTTYPVSVKVLTSTTPNPKHFFSNARPTSVGSTSGGTSESSLQSPATAAPEADQFILSWTLTDHLGTNLLSLICDRIWWNLGWESVEFAAAERAADNRQFLNDARAAFRGEFDKCLEREIQFSRSAAHGLLSVLEQEQYEASAEARNENFLLLVVRYLRRRILLCPNYCLICHRRQAVEFSTLKPFVCNSQLCQHQAQSVGLGKIFETEMVGNEIVIDLLVSLCWAAVEVRALNPAPDQTVAASGLFPMDTNGRVRVVRIGRDGVIGRSTLGGQGYRVDGDVDTSNDNARPHPHSRDSPWSAQFQPGDLLSILNPETQQPLPLSTITLSTFARVVQVSDDHILIDQPVAIPASLALHNQRLPFRIHRKMEQHFVLPNSAPNLPNSKPDLSNSKPDYERLEAVLRKLPPVRTMVAYVHTGSLRRELDALDPLCYPLLSWIISSNRAHLRALDSERELVKVQGGLAAFSSGYSGYKTWRQFVMLMSSPEKEEEFQREKMRLKSESPNKGELYAWHGSRLENWHSIIRTALNFNKVLNGRAYGNGVYMASDAQTSYGYSQQYASNGKAKSQWPQSTLDIRTCLSLNEVINRPDKFVSTAPYLVVKEEHWITTRYLFVECFKDPSESGPVTTPELSVPATPSLPTFLRRPSSSQRAVKYIHLDDSRRPVFLNGMRVDIPERNHGLVADEAPRETSIVVGEFIYANGEEETEEQGDDEDEVMLDAQREGTRSSGKELRYLDDDFEDEDDEDEEEEEDGDENEFDYYSDEDMLDFEDAKEGKKTVVIEEEEDDDDFDPSLLPLPMDATKMATQAISKELRLILQAQSNPKAQLGFLVDAAKLRSVYQWVVHMRDFDPALPLSKDMRDRGVTNIDLEVRFSGDFPHVPPYIRVIRPRLLRFIHGGGGHVTAGGSICMDLLTLGNANDRGWSSIYRMDAVLLQIKLALSSTDPRPARLDSARWNVEYTPREGMEAFIRVANDHGWRVPNGFREMFSK